MSNRTVQAAFLFLLSCTSAAWAQQGSEPPVAVRTEGLPLHVAARVSEKAQQGITELRRYVWISRGVNQLDLRSLLREEEPAQVASREEPPQKVAALDEQH
jgi:hypothetical protein